MGKSEPTVSQHPGEQHAGDLTPFCLRQQDHEQRIAAARARRRRVYPEARRGPIGLGAAFDRAELVERLDGDEALCDDLMALFVVDAPQALTRIEQAVAQADTLALRHETHALKGAAAYVAARPIQRMAERLERAARQEDLQQASSLLQLLSQEIARACRED